MNVGKGVTDKEVFLSANWNPNRQVVEVFGTIDDYVVLPIKTNSKKRGRFEEIEPLMLFDDPTRMQRLFDDLWNMGLRPKYAEEKYTKPNDNQYFEDIRSIAFNCLEIMKRRENHD